MNKHFNGEGDDDIDRFLLSFQGEGVDLRMEERDGESLISFGDVNIRNVITPTGDIMKVARIVGIKGRLGNCRRNGEARTRIDGVTPNFYLIRALFSDSEGDDAIL